MNEIPLSTIISGGSILFAFGFFMFRDKSFGWINKLFDRNQITIEERLNEIELKQNKSFLDIEEKNEEIKNIKIKVKEVIEKAKNEIDTVGNLDKAEELLREFEEW